MEEIRWKAEALFKALILKWRHLTCIQESNNLSLPLILLLYRVCPTT